MINAQNSDTIQSVNQAEWQRTSVKHEVAAPLYSHTTQMRYADNNRFSKVELRYDDQKEKQAHIAQLGKGVLNREVNLSGFNPLPNNQLAWGKASYKNKIIKKPLWNETSDFRLLYPYITGDSIGGDIRSEQYNFTGGYARQIKQWTVATRFDYRGLLEYRNIDPRPKNTVNDVKAFVGAGYLINNKWNMGLDVYAGKYKQTANIAYFSELGATPVYHFVGLARQYARFFGDKTSYYYDGNNMGVSLSIYPADAKGMAIDFDYSFFDCQKIILSLNKLPMSRLKNYQFRSNLIFRNAFNNKLDYGVGASPQYSFKSGQENIFGDPIMNEYRQIASVNQYYETDFYTDAFVFVEYPVVNKLRLSVKPAVTYFYNKEKYILPKRLKQRQGWNKQFQLALAYKKNKTLYSLKTDLFFISPTKSALILEELEDDVRFEKTERQNFQNYAAKQSGGSAALSVYYEFNKLFSTYLKGEYIYIQNDAQNKINGYSLNLGFLF